MKKKMDKMMMISTAVCLLPILLSLIIYDRLPDQVVIHWNAAGEPDDYASKAFAAFGLPFILAAINMFTHFMLNNDPKRANSPVALKLMGKWIVPVVSVIMIPLSLFTSMGVDAPIARTVPAAVGIMVIACGIYLPKCRQNYTVGIKLPWTLDSEENWNRTHRMAGYLWIAGGVCIIVVSLLGVWTGQAIPVIIGILVLVPVFYSYMIYRNGI
ncbi:SdpI family protein [Anaerobium acetethylicum]|uniref:Uncharacterized membrane protein n=1 Tax=Anaerobium acetethylicum TaxID=1619234 RepID=A0A1D3TYP1_9FIRM|nr:SdpI family protein [Anaerobium acetethylicum]SCP99600.1 Uncharacterized membrane protein [Anaerobium acetethylicum]